MSSIKVVFRMGTEDSFESSIHTDKSAYLDLCYPTGSLRFQLGSIQAQLQELNLYPSEVGMDFGILGGAVYAADTRIDRSEYAQDGWTREITLSIPVSDVNLWDKSKANLEQMLRFLTGDLWKFEFRERPIAYSILSPKDDLRLPIQYFTSINLFSGGLDSLVGAIDVLADGQTPLLISHYGEGKSSTAQNACFEGLKRSFPKSSLRRIGSNIRFEKKDFPWKNEEPTTRGRSFLFFSLAAIAASAMLTPTPIIVPENGLISLNIPLEPLRLGALSTRTTHPYYLSLWSNLLESMGVGSGLYNPYQFMTKGEMLAACQKRDILEELIPISVSCSNPTGSRFAQDSHNHCGCCVPCIIRRAAISTGLGYDPTGYRLTDKKLYGELLDSKTADGKNFLAFSYAIQRLAENPNKASILIHKSGPLYGSSKELTDYAELYRRGMDEINTILSDVKTKPCK